MHRVGSCGCFVGFPGNPGSAAFVPAAAYQSKQRHALMLLQPDAAALPRLPPPGRRMPGSGGPWPEAPILWTLVLCSARACTGAAIGSAEAPSAPLARPVARWRANRAALCILCTQQRCGAVRRGALRHLLLRMAAPYLCSGWQAPPAGLPLAWQGATLWVQHYDGRELVHPRLCSDASHRCSPAIGQMALAE